MNALINIKQDDVGAFGFIKPIADSQYIESLLVFRDQEVLCLENVDYVVPFLKAGFLTHLIKLFQMFRYADKSFKLAIGIYEIPHGLLAFIYAKLKRKKVAISIIGNPAYTQLRKGLRKKLSHFMYKHADAVTVTGSRSKHFLEDNGIRGEKVYVLPNAIDVAQFSENPTAKKYDIISIGRLSEEKKIPILLDVVHVLREQFPNIKVAIGGRGPEHDNLVSLVQQKNLQNNVDILGFVDDLVEFYNQGKIFVLTSCTEGLPRTIIEAMACGIPCVAANVGDVSDLVIHENTGFLVEKYDDIDAYITYIKILMQEPMYATCSRNAGEHCRKNFSFQAATSVWNKIILDLGDIQ